MKIVIHKFLTSLIQVALVLIFAFFTAPLISEFIPITDKNIRFLRLISIGLVAWGVLSRPGWRIQTWGGETVQEKTSSIIFLILYLLGLYIAALGVLVVATPTN